jgi:hypothetical protein
VAGFVLLGSSRLACPQNQRCESQRIVDGHDESVNGLVGLDFQDTSDAAAIMNDPPATMESPAITSQRTESARVLFVKPALVMGHIHF